MYEERKCKNQSLIVLYRPLAVFSRHNKNRGCRMWELKKKLSFIIVGSIIAAFTQWSEIEIPFNNFLDKLKPVL